MLVVVEPVGAVGNGVGAPFSTTPQAGAPTPILEALLMKRFDGYVVADGLDEVVVVWRRSTKCEESDLALVKIDLTSHQPVWPNVTHRETASQ